MVVKRISELNIVDINRELLKRGIETGGSKADKLLALEEYIRTKENMDPGSVRFGETDETSAQVPEGITSEAQSGEDEVDSEKNLINHFMEQMLDRLEGLEATVDKQQLTIATLSESVERLERELAEEKLRSTERVEQASCSCRGNSQQPSTSDMSGANQICPDKSQNLPVKTQSVSFESRWANIRSRLTGENPRNRSVSGVSGNRSGVSGETSGVFGDLAGVFGEVSGSSREEALRSSFSGGKRVHFPDSLLIPQNELNMARASIPEFAGKREEDPVRFLLQAEAILEETGIHKARWVTVLAPQLKAQAGTWWGTMRALDLPWQEFRSELLEKFNGDELQSSLQSELLSTAQTKTETLGEYVLHKYQLYRRLNLRLTEEAVVMTVIGLMRDEFRIHARIQRLKSFSELRALAHVLDGSKAVMSDKAGVSTSVPPKLKWLDKRKAESAEKSQVPNPKQRQSSGAGCRVCGSHDHWQAACPKRKSESGNAKTTGGTAGSRPARK